MIVRGIGDRVLCAHVAAVKLMGLGFRFSIFFGPQRKHRILQKKNQPKFVVKVNFRQTKFYFGRHFEPYSKLTETTALLQGCFHFDSAHVVKPQFYKS